MSKRNLRVLKWIGTTPAIGVCSSCDRQFTVPVTALKRVADAQQSLSLQFAQHDCVVRGDDETSALFTFRVTTANSQQDVFVAFMDHAILFASFTGVLPAGPSNPYDYLYGVGLK